MRVLLDTHIFLWAIQEDAKLSAPTKTLIKDAQAVFVSTASIWELAIKASRGKLNVDVSMLADAIAPSGFTELPVRVPEAVRVSSLAFIHGDPFDRILIAQAMVGSMRFLTADRVLKQYSPIVIAA